MDSTVIFAKLIEKKRYHHSIYFSCMNGIIWIAIPVMNESEYLPQTVNCLFKQDFPDFRVVFCINQPEKWGGDPAKLQICEDNLKTLQVLQGMNDPRFTVIDRCSPGKGWEGNHYGVGWARKTAMDYVMENADPDDFILSLDADTVVNRDYISLLIGDLDKNRDIAGITIRYYHPLTGIEKTDRAILRYEIYMRLYAINMMRAGLPYAFTALGSAMGCPVKVYRTIRGITPHKSGEDFYFIEKLYKHGKILVDTNSEVFPAARFSDRVFFGTGPAMIKGVAGDWSSYPFYLPEFFEEIRQSFSAFRHLPETDLYYPMKEYLSDSFKNPEWWVNLSMNFKIKEQFYRACCRKVDGLIILQYLRYRQKSLQMTDLECLRKNIEHHFVSISLENFNLHRFSFEASEISLINDLRNHLTHLENALRKQLHAIAI